MFYGKFGYRLCYLEAGYLAIPSVARVIISVRGLGDRIGGYELTSYKTQSAFWCRSVYKCSRVKAWNYNGGGSVLSVCLFLCRVWSELSACSVAGWQDAKVHTRQGPAALCWEAETSEWTVCLPQGMYLVYTHSLY